MKTNIISDEIKKLFHDELDKVLNECATQHQYWMDEPDADSINHYKKQPSSAFVSISFKFPITENEGSVVNSGRIVCLRDIDLDENK